ncbi:myb transcription factor [Thraustotheca clavata]|uniref:Myb transcription factor n=1 Tax=Thraustotheca clavata TaxID=74557 RepID=A0A1V9ZC08_9STRA|nr:myb transcription factor [Thraustotheca clavata]
MNMVLEALAANNAYVAALEDYVRVCSEKEAQVRKKIADLKARVLARSETQVPEVVAISSIPKLSQTAKKRLRTASKEHRSKYFEVPCSQITGGFVALYYTNPDAAMIERVRGRLPTLEAMTLKKWKSSEIKALQQATSTLTDWVYVKKTAKLDKTPLACQLRYLMLAEENHEKQNPWSSNEDEMLQQLAATSHDWKQISQTLHEIHKFPPRLPVSCLIRHQTHFNSDLFSQTWTAEEDALLITTMATAVNEHNVWQLVAEKMGIQHTPDQCGYRWRHFLCPLVKHGPFSIEEDRRLLLALYVVSEGQCLTQRNESHWQSVQQYLPGRTNVQCSQRFREALNPLKKTSPFTHYEDQIILHGVQEYGQNAWQTIADKLNDRYPDQVRKRWKSLETRRLTANNEGLPTRRIPRGANKASTVKKVMTKTTRKAPKRKSTISQDKSINNQTIE